jgi:hypothetical protein
MKDFSTDTFGWVVLSVCLFVGFKLILNYWSKRSEEKRIKARRAELRALREARDDKRPTLADAVEQELDFLRTLAPRGSDTAEARSEIWARLMLDADLGRHAEGPAPYGLDQSQRDTLLANARKDAAEALKNTRALMSEVRALRKAIDEIVQYSAVALVIVLIVYWWKSHAAT